jgi:hypothetical protein
MKRPHFRFWHFSDLTGRNDDVGSWEVSGPPRETRRGRLNAQSG